MLPERDRPNEEFHVYSVDASQEWIKENSITTHVKELEAEKWGARDIAKCIGNGLLFAMNLLIMMNPETAKHHHVNISGGSPGGNMAENLQNIRDLIRKHKGNVYTYPSSKGQFSKPISSGTHLVKRGEKIEADSEFRAVKKKAKETSVGSMIWKEIAELNPVENPTSQIFVVSREAPESAARHGLRTGMYTYSAEDAFRLKELLEAKRLIESDTSKLGEITAFIEQSDAAVNPQPSDLDLIEKYLNIINEMIAKIDFKELNEAKSAHTPQALTDLADTANKLQGLLVHIDEEDRKAVEEARHHPSKP